MCIAIYKPKGLELRDFVFTNSWSHNSDGAGYAYRDANGTIRIKKGFMKLRSLKKSIETTGKYNEMILHFRFATHGLTDKDNTHPFPVADGAFIHNGVLSGKRFTEQIRSDTRILAEDILHPLYSQYPMFGSMEAEQVVLDRMMGYSKGILMLPTQTIIMNEEDGYWDSKCWFSNKTYSYEYKKVRYTTSKPYQQNQLYNKTNRNQAQIGSSCGTSGHGLGEYQDYDDYFLSNMNGNTRYQSMDGQEDCGDSLANRELHSLTDAEWLLDNFDDLTDQELGDMGLRRSDLVKERTALDGGTP